MDQDSNQEPGKRLRNLLSDRDREPDTQPEPHDQSPPQPPTRSPLFRLPKRKVQAQEEQPSLPPGDAVDSPESKENVYSVSHVPLSAGDSGVPRDPEQSPPPGPPAFLWRGKLGPAFWTVTGIMSLVLNAVLIAVLVLLYNLASDLRDLQGSASNIGTSVLGGMYTNFEKMDRATIRTVIPVDAEIPLDITVPVQTTTEIRLASAATISNAHVVINTGVLSIDAPATVTLPAGTPLMVELDFDLPVKDEIPVHLEVPVNIPMADTELHEPFVGLQNVVRPWYCILEPRAFSLSGKAICR